MGRKGGCAASVPRGIWTVRSDKCSRAPELPPKQEKSCPSRREREREKKNGTSRMWKRAVVCQWRFPANVGWGWSSRTESQCHSKSLVLYLRVTCPSLPPSSPWLKGRKPGCRSGARRAICAPSRRATRRSSLMAVTCRSRPSTINRPKWRHQNRAVFLPGTLTAGERGRPMAGGGAGRCKSPIGPSPVPRASQPSLHLIRSAAPPPPIPRSITTGCHEKVYRYTYREWGGRHPSVQQKTCTYTYVADGPDSQVQWHGMRPNRHCIM